MSENLKDNYSIMFTNYPDIVNIEQMRKCLVELVLLLPINYLNKERLNL